MASRGVLRASILFTMVLLAGCEQPETGRDDGTNKATTAPSPVALLPLRITTSGGGIRAFSVELAVDEASQQMGLMGRTSLAPDQGMLFPFSYPETASFWMKDTPLPLDLLFIRPDGTIAAILQGQPRDLHPLSAQEPVSAVLEINQGRAKALGIRTGDKVSWGDCNSPPPASGVWRADRFCPEASQ